MADTTSNEEHAEHAAPAMLERGRLRGTNRNEAMSPTNTNANLLRGTLDLLILRALSGEARHGYGVLEWIEAAVSPALIVEEGTLYPALHRLEAEGWIASKWGVSENNRKAKYYRLTRKGARRATADAAAWHEYAEQVSRALGGAAPA